ncbi:hypothetical protein [Pleomorphovibrio marinus]|uniref:hypothetical protein n=1 Tax=Pleomorphovibrio marinus TaxID=2164132 RepID=UPI000E0B8EB7|nr:hypothetical protein [Pleomorphovibrio marinus]
MKFYGITFASLIIVLFLILSAGTALDETINVTFEGVDSQHKWALSDLNPELPSDWSSHGYLTFDMETSTTQKFDLQLFDANGMRRLEIWPVQGARMRASIPLIHFQERNTKGLDMASIGKVPRPGYWIHFSGEVGTITQVDSIGVMMRQPIGTQTMEISNVRLTMAAEDTIFTQEPLVDEFGQWIPADWPGKARTLEELTSAWREEEASLVNNEFNVSTYGGFLDAKTTATGFFRVEKIDDTWWFVDPEGYLFFSAGVTCMRNRCDLARVEGREYIYKELPSGEIMATAWKAGTGATSTQDNPSFYTWNLHRRFGADWFEKWIDHTMLRMESWGLNTIANWSDAALARSSRMPYVENISGWGIGPNTMGLPDVYVADYEAKVDSAAARQCAPLKDDPYLLGYFIGNEQPWPNREQELARVILEGEDIPMKTALEQYLAEGDTPERRKAFIYETYTKFLDIVNSAIKRHDPNHLNLGIRYGGMVPEEIAKASKGFDVFSINVYGYDANEKVKHAYDLTGLPVIIGEYHFGTAARGLSPWLAQVSSLEERGVGYRYYVENAAAHPALIGTHWFQWIDQPATGRGDGENGLIGFLDVTDLPYSDLVEAAKETHKRLYDVHSGSIPPVSRQAERQ